MYRIIKITDHAVVDFAAEELKKYLRMMMPEAGDISISRAEKADTVCGFCLGVMADLGLDTSEAADIVLDDILHIDTTATGGVIAGSNPRSVLLAVYRFLQENGCRWLYPGVDGEHVPIRDVTATQYRKMADNRYRGQCNEGAESQQCMLETIDFTPKIGMNVYMIEFDNPYTYYASYYDHEGNRENRTPEPVSYDTVKQWKRVCECEIEKRGLQLHDMGHGWTADPFGISTVEGWKRVEEDKVTDEVRQYLAYRGASERSPVAGRRFCGGVPLNTNLCMSNPEARAKVVDSVVRYAKSHTNVDYIHVWLADACNNHCECEACQKMRPADWYMMMMNELDEALSACGSPAHIAFIAYVDTLWAPEQIEIRNPARFSLLFAPIARKYLTSLDPKHIGATTPYLRNHLRIPKTIEDCFAYLRDWQKMWKGSVFCYEYHFWINQYYDLGGLYFARRIHEDVKALPHMGVCGVIEDGSQRSFWPNGLGFYVYAQTLFDTGADFDALVADYFTHAYGEHAAFAKDYLSEIGELFEYAYMKGERTTDRTYGKFYDPARAARMQRVGEVCAKARAYVLEHYRSDVRVQTVSMLLLYYHTLFCEALAKAMLPKMRGDHTGAKAAFDRLFEEFGKHELAIERYYDQYMLRAAYKKIYEEQFQNSITQIIG